MRRPSKTAVPTAARAELMRDSGVSENDFSPQTEPRGLSSGEGESSERELPFTLGLEWGNFSDILTSVLWSIAITIQQRSEIIEITILSA